MPATRSMARSRAANQQLHHTNKQFAQKTSKLTMATSNATNQTRYDALKAAVESSVEATRDQGAAPIPACPETPKCFDENVNNGEDMKAMSIHLRCSLVKGLSLIHI